ncbi:MAG: amino acid permease, partial [Actinomycetota bacterium]
SISRIHPRWGTPVRAILICTVICSIAALGPFQTLVVVDVTIYAFALLLQFIALIALRIRYPNLRRPYRIPGGWLGLALVCLGPLFVLAVAIYFQVLDVGLVQGVGWALVGMATGPIAYYLLRPGKLRRGVDHTVDLEFDEPVLSEGPHTEAS